MAETPASTASNAAAVAPVATTGTATGDAEQNLDLGFSPPSSTTGNKYYNNNNHSNDNDGDAVSNCASSHSSNSNHWHAHRQNHNPSKLPTFRYTDLRKETLALPTLLTQNHGNPTSPVSPRADSNQPSAPPQPPAATQTAKESKTDSTRDGSALVADSQYNTVSQHNSPGTTAALPQHVASSRTRPAGPRASTYQTPSKPASTPATRPANPKRSVSLDASAASPTVAAVSQPASSASTAVASARPQRRRAPSQSETTTPLRPKRFSFGSQTGTPEDEVTKQWAQGQRELLLPRTIQKAESDGRRNSVVRRPPVSYRPPITSTPSTGGSAKIPPIRSFRSSGDRQSLGADMTLRSPSNYEGDSGDSNHRDWALKALEGRREEDDTAELTPPESAIDQQDPDDSGDVFLKMAREEPEPTSAAARVIRSAHRRPLSSVIPSYQPKSPPQVTRRLSEQEPSRSKSVIEKQPTEKVARALTYQTSGSNNASDSKTPSSKPSPLTPRTLTFQDAATESASAYSRRRQSITDNVSGLTSRMSSLKQQGNSPYTFGRTYNSSPLALKPIDTQKQESNNGDHHTESSNSTAAPSTVWDELDDIKSRIHRLELTGKMPSTSGAAASRSSDDRPPTATTNATTMSASPKAGTGGGTAAQADAVSTVSSSRGTKESYPLLQSAMTKSKPFLAPDVFSALESAASDAMTLSGLIGKVGEPGPVSSAASNAGNAAVTDRQLRRKAEGICRSLTELCLALSENATQNKPQEETVPAPEPQFMASPTITRFTGVSTQRRPSAALVERSPGAAAVSPRAMSRLEERRSSMLFANAIPSPGVRFSSQVPSTPTDGAGRRTSLLIPRTRRAGTEEPETFGAGRSSSLLLRHRRAGTEEPEEFAGRQSSLLRTRRGTIDKEDNDAGSRFRAPSRTVTEIAAGPRPPAIREFNPQIPIPSIETTSLATSALPRRRLAASNLNSRLAQPSTNSSLAARRYLGRTTPDRETNNLTEKLAEDRGQRSTSHAQSSLHHRTMSLPKRSRDNMLASSSTISQPGGYR